MTRKEFVTWLTAGTISSACLPKLWASEEPKSLLSSSSYLPITRLEATARLLDVQDTSSISRLARAVLDVDHSFEMPDVIKQVCVSRVLNAERLYLEGITTGLHENDVLKLLNDTFQFLNAPAFAQVSPHQLRVIRVRLLRDTPVFMGSGITKAHAHVGDSINPYMSPLQATHLSLMVVDQKFLNEDFQYEPTEWEAHYALMKKREAERYEQRFSPAVGQGPSTYRSGAFTRLNPKGAELSKRLTESTHEMSLMEISDFASQCMSTLGL